MKKFHPKYPLTQLQAGDHPAPNVPSRMLVLPWAAIPWLFIMKAQCNSEIISLLQRNAWQHLQILPTPDKKTREQKELQKSRTKPATFACAFVLKWGSTRRKKKHWVCSWKSAWVSKRHPNFN